MKSLFQLLFLFPLLFSAVSGAEPVSVSGIYPHLAMFNQEGECGTGAVVPWADRLWVITYAPHMPKGSTDKLYEITPDLQQIIRPESIGGTPANRMIHRESQQLFIGPYAINSARKVRTIPYTQMLGRPTGNARHLTEAAHKIYFATMEEGFYEVDVETLAVKELYPDGHAKRGSDLLPGYHGKGLYSAQGRLVYANNGENSELARKKPNIPSGCLAQWSGQKWEVVRRNQFTEVTGPGGIHGNEKESDPLWTIGWDHRSLILMLLDGGVWHTYRLPKASHSYDGAHGWNTEWPRIREIGEEHLLMTMHGTFWSFPATFRAKDSAGITPRSNYLKVIGDFCRWQDRIVFGCDDAAKSEFLNTRKLKGKLAGPGLSHSNLWFVNPEELDQLGPAIGRGAVWLNDNVLANQPSDAFLFDGYQRRGLHLRHHEPSPVAVVLEVDRTGNGEWSTLREIEIPANGYHWESFAASESAAWLRIRTKQNSANTTAMFAYAQPDTRTQQNDVRFHGLANVESTHYSGGLLRASADANKRLHFAAAVVQNGQASAPKLYAMDADLKLVPSTNSEHLAELQKQCAVPRGVVRIEESSVLVIDDQGRRYRLPKGHAAYEQETALPLRVDREICTERDLFQVCGSFFELPAENADGLAKIRPLATHNCLITDYCSWRGLLVLAGVTHQTSAHNAHIVRSDDGQAAVWLGAVDDLWKLGKPRGQGGPWLKAKVSAHEPSDPYLFTGYDHKHLALEHESSENVDFQIELDVSGSGDWQPWSKFEVKAGEKYGITFPEHLAAYWIRFTADRNCIATARLSYQ